MRQPAPRSGFVLISEKLVKSENGSISSYHVSEPVELLVHRVSDSDLIERVLDGVTELVC